jgi:putative PIN family toxin of toxin-antitoxin system
MKVVLDTNVLVAAFATHGLCSAVLELCLDQHEIGISRQLLGELRRNLIKKVKLPEQTADEIVLFLESRATMVVPAAVDKSACRDPDDLKILGTAIAFGSDFLITGDQDLLVLKEVKGSHIVSPGSFAHALGHKGKGHRTKRSA